jgi:cysteinyl-tRNA synthetase
MHNAFLTVGENEKMAKSGENFTRLQTLEDRGIDPLAYRYLLLTARYSSPLQFSWEALEGAQVALKKIRAKIQELKNVEHDTETEDANILIANARMFSEYINDDLSTPQALALVWQVLNDYRVSGIDRVKQVLDFDRVLGLELDKKVETEPVEIPVEVQQLITLRNQARAEKDFAKSDEIRTQIESFGFDVMDTPEGTKVSKK